MGSTGRAAAVAVVVPAHRVGHEMERCLAALAALDPAPAEVVVVADGPAPGVRSLAEGRGFRVVSSLRRAGPAAARNLGAEATTAELILFVDSDVVAPEDLAGRVAALFAGHPGVAALFGSYDDHSPAPGLVSQFKNLLHHHTHQRAAAEASTFWTGCGAVRRRAFLTVGGFDPGQRWLEDVELGYRLRAAGHRILLDPTLRVTHLKRWSLPALVASDVAHRAWPWTGLMYRYRSLPRDLNLSTGGRISGACSLLLLAALAALPWQRHAGWIAAAAAAALLVVNASLYVLFLRRRGVVFALGAIPLHWLYLFYSVATFAAGILWWRVRRVVDALGRHPQGTNDRDCNRAE